MEIMVAISNYNATFVGFPRPVIVTGGRHTMYGIIAILRQTAQEKKVAAKLEEKVR